ncbi:MAG TPA: hypothetical protein VNE41_08280 [Chitinophagaceae bacterium]|nr:hypothetical protein [Chitinophagaceae bacterium]
MIWFIFRIILRAALLILILIAAIALIQIILYLKRENKILINREGPSLGNLDTRRDMMSLRLQAYERLVLLAERISPRHLVPRLHMSQSTARDLQFALVQAIRAEFDHNVSQQIYVSTASWEGICNAKEQLISLINELADQFPEGSGGDELAKMILELEMENSGNFPVQIALTVLNAEVRKLMEQGRR